MPLSEEELRLLEQMERALVEEDPKLASTLRGTTLRSAARRRAIAAGACFVIGIVVLMTGVISELTVVGIAGFVIMLASATFGLAQLRGQRGAPHPVGGATRPRQRLHRLHPDPRHAAAAPAARAVPPPRSWTAWRSAGGAAASKASDPTTLISTRPISFETGRAFRTVPRQRLGLDTPVATSCLSRAARSTTISESADASSLTPRGRRRRRAGR